MLGFHIGAGALSLLVGFLALAAAKGRRVHRWGGMVFVAAMTAMGLSAAVLGNVTGGLLATYMVVTAHATLRPVCRSRRWLERAAAATAVALGLATVWRGAATLAGGSLVSGGVPVPMLFFMGSVALGAGVADVRLLVRGLVPAGRSRIRRHLWRMCFALFIASGSFFLGQADEFPARLRVYPVLAFLALLPLMAMGLWFWRLRKPRRRLHSPASAPPDRTRPWSARALAI